MTLGVLLAIGSALVWGSGDYCGGRAARRHDPFQVLALAATSGIALLAVAAAVVGESLPSRGDLAWAAVAGAAGACGIVALYRGLAVASAATVAPLAAVTAATLPVLFAFAVEGPPRPAQLAGFLLALAGIWLVTRAAADRQASRTGARLGVLAGIGFGAFLILIAQVAPATVYVPLAVARVVMLAAAVGTLSVRRIPIPVLGASPVALLAGVLDAGGNILYLLAQHRVRLDVAAVLSSLYPAATVALSRLVGGEPVTRTQWIGAAVCLAAVVLIAG